MFEKATTKVTQEIGTSNQKQPQYINPNAETWKYEVTNQQLSLKCQNSTIKALNKSEEEISTNEFKKSNDKNDQWS
jgi:hypothetical protein